MFTRRMAPDPVNNDQPRAFVIVPFETIDAAQQWAAATVPDNTAMPVLITAGEERPWFDPTKGVAGTELSFVGGWRAKYAGSGTVVIARCEDAEVPQARVCA